MNTEMLNGLPNISDFPYLQASLLENFSKVYTPDMGPSELKCCQTYYQRHRRAPKSADELAFLNAFVAKNRRNPDTILISEMITDDKFLAETFADLMAKRAAVSPDYKMPCSIAETLKIAQKYLDGYQKKPSALDTLVFSCEKHHMLALAAKKASPTRLAGDKENGLSGGESLSYALGRHAPLSSGDKVYALLRSADPMEDFEEKLLSLATLPSLIAHAKRLCPIDDRGLLSALTELGMGFDVDLQGLYGEDASATRLLDGEVGLLILVKAADASELLMNALDFGLRPLLVGELNKDGQILLKQDEVNVLCFSLHFLKALSFSRAYHVKMAPRAAKPSALSLSDSKLETLGRDLLFLTSAKGDDSRLSALYAALYAVSSLIARGARLSDLRIAHRFELALSPISSERLGNQLAMLLGLYRVIAELELHTLSAETVAAKEPSFTLYALAQNPDYSLPDMLTRNDSSVYLLEPLYDQNGNPDFEDYKNMLEYVGNLQRRGSVRSARAVVGDVLPTLERMSKNTIVEYLQDGPCVARAGSILLETRERIQGTLIARTYKPVERAPEEQEKCNNA